MNTRPNPAVKADAPGARISAFVTRNGMALLLNGQPYRFDGLNIYNANGRDQCNYAMATGANLDNSLSAGDLGSRRHVFRAWFFQSLATTNGVRNWSSFDHTVAVAQSHGERVIATLANQWGDCESGGYKTEAWYQSDYKTQIPTGLLRTYRDWVAEVVARYKDNPTVLAWQLMNEAEDAQSNGGACSSTANATLKAFAQDLATVVKGIDPNHLLSLGTIGSGQCGASGASYQDLHSIPGIDLCEYHDYGAPTIPMPGDQWNGLATRISQCRALAKPLFVGESGISKIEVGGIANRAADWDAKFSVQFAAGVVGELIWDWDLYQPTDPYSLQPGDPALALLSKY